MEFWLKYDHSSIYSARPILKEMVQEFCDQDSEVQRVRSEGAVVGKIMGGVHYRNVGRYQDWVYHWTIKFEPRKFKPVHVASPLWGLPDWLITDILADRGYTQEEITDMIRDPRTLPFE